MRRAAVAWLVLVLTLTGCSGGTEPEAIRLRTDPEDVAEAANVLYVGMTSSVTPFRVSGPLWGDQDQEKVAHVLGVIRRAVPVSDPKGAEPFSAPLNTHVVVHYKDGREVKVDHAWRQLPSSAWEGVPGRYWVSGVGEVASDELDRFYRVDRVSLLQPRSPLSVEPEKVRLGELIRVEGHGWVKASRARLLIQDNQGEQVLGEVDVIRGDLTWNGNLPAGLRPYGPRNHVALVLEFDGGHREVHGMELVR